MAYNESPESSDAVTNINFKIGLWFSKITLTLKRKLLVENITDRLQKTDYELIFTFDMNYSSHLPSFLFC